MWLHRKPQYHEFYEHKERENAAFFGGKLGAREVEEAQLRKLTGVLDYVRSRSPYYARTLASQPNPRTLAELRALPFTTKDQLKQFRSELLSVPLRECDLYCETTGTTGEAAPSLRHTLDRVWINSNWVYGWRAVLGERTGRIVGISGPSELHGMVDTFTDVFQSLGHCVAKIYPFSTKVNFTKALKVMRDLPVDVLCITPTLALMMAKAALLDPSFDLRRDFKLSHIFLTGELCSEAMCQNVASFWGARTTNNPFASQEALGLSVGGADGQLYTLPLSYIYELIDPESEQPLETPGRGELVVTMLEPGARPLLRFKTGDLVELRRPIAGAPLASDVLSPLGRTKDEFEIEGKRLNAYQVEDSLLRSLRRVLSYQFKIEPSASGPRLVAELELPAGEAASEAVIQAAADGFRQELGVKLEIRQVPHTDGAASMSAIAGWKAARIKDLTREMDAERSLAERIGSARKV